MTLYNISWIKFEHDCFVAQKMTIFRGFAMFRFNQHTHDIWWSIPVTKTSYKVLTLRSCLDVGAGCKQHPTKIGWQGQTLFFSFIRKYVWLMYVCVWLSQPGNTTSTPATVTIPMRHSTSETLDWLRPQRIWVRSFSHRENMGLAV